MQLIAPDVLLAAKGLSVGAGAGLAVVGTLLWAAGWRFHRFWVVFGVSMTAGVLGLSASRAAAGQQVMVVGVLVAVAAGVMALEIAKFLAFASGGSAAWVGVQAVLPEAQELWAVFLSGGLVGVLLYRVWTMLVTSLAGVLVSWHAGLTVAGTLDLLDAPGWAAAHTAELNGAAVAAAVFGVVVQARTSPRPAEEPAPAPVEEPAPTLLTLPTATARRGWGLLRAG